MIWVSKIKSDETESVNELFCTNFSSADTVFGLYDGDLIGVGALKTTDGKTFELVTAFVGDVNDGFKEMLIRATLASVRDFDYFVKTVLSHKCLKTLGFKENEAGQLEAVSSNLTFDCCKRKN